MRWQRGPSAAGVGCATMRALRSFAGRVHGFPMLIFHHSNDLGLLRDLAVHRIAQSPPPPLEPEHVVVPHAGMAKWFRRGVMEAQGIAADLSCDSKS